MSDLAALKSVAGSEGWTFQTLEAQFPLDQRAEEGMGATFVSYSMLAR